VSRRIRHVSLKKKKKKGNVKRRAFWRGDATSLGEPKAHTLVVICVVTAPGVAS
jgi:hypothetical protein